MIFDPTTFTGLHTWLSLVALVAGVFVVIGLIGNRTRPLWTVLFLAAAVATSVTGFGFPFTRFLPSHGVGVVALVILAVASLARYGFRYAGAWRWIYAAASVASLYLLVFVAIAQAFQKVPSLARLAPTASEPPFVITQLVVLALFAGLGIAAARTFQPGR
jgi:hypothetical protein